MNKKTVLNICVIALLSSCSGVKSEYEQDARNRAVSAAKILVDTDHDNIMKMEEAILEAKSVRSEYLLLGDTIASQAFDKAFEEYVTANDSILAQELFKK